MEINKDTYIEDIINGCEKSISVFRKYDINVFICSEPIFDTLEGVCTKKGVDIDKLIIELKEVCK